MTLTITIITPRVAYQCADYRLQDLETKRVYDFDTQKTTLVNRPGWTALVAFAGIGKAAGTDVSDWLADKVQQLPFDAPFEALTDALLLADAEWLGGIQDPVRRRHTFSIGAFVGSTPVFGIVSNFEEPSGQTASTAQPSLSCSVLRVRRPIVFVCGQHFAVPRSERRRLRAFVERDPDPESVYEALAEVNREVSTRNSLVSPACWVVHTRLTGDGGGRGFGLDGRPFVPRALSDGDDDAIRGLLDDHFGEGQGVLRGFTTVRMEASEEYHQTQLREKPEDPNVHSNYGAFLADAGQQEEAEAHYRIALGIQSDHANALGNLANLESARDRPAEAEILYERALASEPGQETVTWNFARFLAVRGERARAVELVSAGLFRNPQSGRLHNLMADLKMSTGDVDGALAAIADARLNGGDQAYTESLYACALQLSGASVGECIAAYESARILNPTNVDLQLNLAQLLFLRGDHERALTQLPPVDALPPDSRLERLFYLLAHTTHDSRVIGASMTDLVEGGARSSWNFELNIAQVELENPEGARILRAVAEALKGGPSDVLDGLTQGTLTING